MRGGCKSLFRSFFVSERKEGRYGIDKVPKNRLHIGLDMLLR